MENATKALLIAAGILFAVMIMSLLLVGYNQISSYYSAQHEEQQIKQLADYNKIFQNYNRKKIRGNEMISLMNRVIDYNERQAYDESKKYPRMRVTIKLGANVWQQFTYKPANKTNINDTIFKNVLNGDGDITNVSNSSSNKTNDKTLVQITNVDEDLKNKYPSLNLTEDKLQKLSSNISNIMIKEDTDGIDSKDTSQLTPEQETERSNREKRLKLLKDILGISESVIKSNMGNIKDAACKYYELTQFKRAYFDCNIMNYDKSTGRINEMVFIVKITNGNIELN